MSYGPWSSQLPPLSQTEPVSPIGLPSRDGLCALLKLWARTEPSFLKLYLGILSQQQTHDAKYVRTSPLSPNQLSSVTNYIYVYYEFMEMFGESGLWPVLTKPEWILNSSLPGLYLERGLRHHVMRSEATLNAASVASAITEKATLHFFR